MNELKDFLDFEIPQWQYKSACSEEDTWKFLTNKSHSRARDDAMYICNNECPVKTQCLAWALDIEAREKRTMHGIYGGMSQQDRLKIRLKNGKKLREDAKAGRAKAKQG